MNTNKPSTFRFFTGLILAALLGLSITSLALAQDEYRINVNKEFGFANGSDIRGDFSIAVVGDETVIQSVSFQIEKEWRPFPIHVKGQIQEPNYRREHLLVR